MSYLNRLSKLVFSRQTLMLAVILVAAAAVWFIGPLIAFGDYRPLETVLSRTLSIVVLLALLLFWLLGWSPVPIGVALLFLALWYFGPLIAFGDAHPFSALWSRVLLISVLLACYAIYGIYRLLKAVQSDGALLQRLLHPFANKPDAKPLAREEMRALNSVVAKAIEKLKHMRGGPAGLRRLLENQRYLYELPWYMVIGSPGAGKTTLILNSGLDFPDADQMVATSLKKRVETANCDWWFANEAVLIDTAGRYTFQDAVAQNGARQEQKQEEKPGEKEGEQQQDPKSANAAEWHGFLALLRKRRPRAPINGALLTVSAEELLTRAPSERKALAASMRARLGELRQQLGIRFPVYVLVTKLDLLPGFGEYFQSFTAESRAQILGFTLPYQQEREEHRRDALRLSCVAEMRELEQGLEDGINTRLQEVYEVDRRRKLYALPSEFRSLCAELTELLALVFLDSKYDDTQLGSTLRGVYFTSAAQTHDVVCADRTTLLQRLRRGLTGLFGGESKMAVSSSGDGAPTAYRGYFLRNLFQRVILAEGHLVRPNLYWEIRFRALRLVGHLLSIVVAVWLIGALIVSFENNRDYLAVIGTRTDALATRVMSQRKAPRPGALGPVLSASRDLPQFHGMDLGSPGIAWRYGLYTVPAVSDAASVTYGNLLNQMLLPQIVNRLEAGLDAQIGAQDADGVYRTLSVYLMLFDRSHYDAKAIKAWVLSDWEHAESVASLGERSVMARHLDALFADGEPAVPARPVNAPLVARARNFLGRNPASGRLYERATNAMTPEAPESITLISAAGPQAMAVFSLAEGSTLERGIPGLYTYEGYHAVFNRRLPEFLEQAQKQDAWVMGEADASARWKLAANGDMLRTRKDRLADEIRRQYLTDYGNYWQQFLDDVRPVSGGDGTLALDLQTLRTLAAPDSPLARLARTAVHETSLSVAEGADDPSLADSAMNAITRRSQAARAASAVAATATIGQIAQQKMERELVGNRFAALREVVTGRADAGGGSAPAQTLASGGGTLRLDAIIGLINEQYTHLVMAGNVLAANTMPPVDDLGSTLQLEAEKLPAPFRAVLAGIASQSMRKVDRGVGSLLALQVESSVGAECRGAIEGKYPFAASAQEVDVDDFNRVFAAGGLLDDFFQKTLASHVDTSIRPWRYKSVSPGMPPMQGPSLEPFEHAATIRQVFFRDPGANRMAWKMGLKVVSLDPEITDLLIDIDGQSTRYAHGPVTTFPVTWPGPRGGSMAGITANPRIRPDTSTITAEGPWALFRLIDRGRVTSTLSSSRSAVDFSFDDRHAVLELTSGAQSGPQLTGLLRGFRCPGDGSAAGGRAAALLADDTQ
ncbi:type VI secretion system membrane subunit TssM [Paraburkholderia susongensis]|uniref:Type VI secretion system protein ImpL n=1 Tax=Paraburkholderia susongensis TaxID=1515439 RepID=A0A1X7LM01_9BURK|nr:type VI secretion system membrane subunit TssM [Paraburkholderia susongensis]SMG54179.1 type VI secretion system protein ImpL [Paraburkholderia susongensis]